jgi:hypothetical protein
MEKVTLTGYDFEWKEMKEDLGAMQEVVLEEGGKKIVFGTACKGNAGKIFQSVGVAIPPTVSCAMN